jgi:CBS-domain-containing membrane protein
MTCRSIMNADSPRLTLPMTVAEATQALFQEMQRSLPVVDQNGQYMGLFGSHQLLLLALPKAARIDEEQGFAFLSDGADVIAERLKAVAQHPLERYLDQDSPAVGPDMSIMEGLHLLYRHRDDLPVVEAESKRFLGLISARKAVAKLMEQV